MRLVLTYHSIDESGSIISIRQSRLARHIAWLARARFDVLSLDEVVRYDGDRDVVALTFDDGFKNFHELALPLLLEHGLPATVFVVSDRTGGFNVWDKDSAGIPTLPLMSWNELAHCAEHGVEIGGHGRTHRSLTELSEEELENEIGGCSSDITKVIGVRPVAFAYPFGLYDEHSRECVSMHFDVACTTDLREVAATDEATAIPRIDACYLSGPAAIESLGTFGFTAWMQIRRAARNLRRSPFGRAVVP